GLNLIRPALIALAVIATFYGGFHLGGKLERAELEGRAAALVATLTAKLANLSKESVAAEAVLKAARMARAQMGEILTNEAFQDPDAARLALGVDGVRRLNRAR
ncbi:MAG: hypothetical protein COB08_016820, partial [Rhodobacteraceae bacterium]|nr:hypothetical protein [Paracoccaceae bacterium]